jgi:hypothetical protein
MPAGFITLAEQSVLHLATRHLSFDDWMFEALKPVVILCNSIRPLTSVRLQINTSLTCGSSYGVFRN